MATVDTTSGSRRCAQCGMAFHCGVDDPAPCWCATLPPLAAERLTAGTACVCEACLRQRLTQPQPAQP
jgi:hypothetical protein